MGSSGEFLWGGRNVCSCEWFRKEGRSDDIRERQIFGPMTLNRLEGIASPFIVIFCIFLLKDSILYPLFYTLHFPLNLWFFSHQYMEKFFSFFTAAYYPIGRIYYSLCIVSKFLLSSAMLFWITVYMPHHMCVSPVAASVQELKFIFCGSQHF